MKSCQLPGWCQLPGDPLYRKVCVTAIGISGEGSTRAVRQSSWALRYREVAPPRSRYLGRALRALRYREVCVTAIEIFEEGVTGSQYRGTAIDTWGAKRPCGTAEFALLRLTYLCRALRARGTAIDTWDAKGPGVPRSLRYCD